MMGKQEIALSKATELLKEASELLKAVQGYLQSLELKKLLLGVGPANLEELLAVLKEQPDVLDVLDGLLFYAIYYGNHDRTVIRRLLECGASPAKEFRIRGQKLTALSYAVVEWSKKDFKPGLLLDDICRQLKHAVEPPVAKEPPSFLWIDYYEYLFGEPPPLGREPQDRKSAIKILLTDVAEFLNLPEKCWPLLTIIEEQLTIEWRKTHRWDPPKLDEKEYDLERHDGTLFPIPKAEYKPSCFPKKNSVLQRTLYRMLREAGLVTSPAQKWIRGIPAEIANEYLRQGIFFVEDTRDPVGDLHGKESHNIQRLLICLAIQKGLIKTKVGDFEISIQELFSSLADSQFAHKDTKKLAWVSLIDSRYKSKISFTDPHRLQSFIMTSPHRDQFRLLSDCTIHTFCNGVVKIAEVLNDSHGSVWDPRMVWDRILSCINTAIFLDFNLSLLFQEKKGCLGHVIARGKGVDDYAIIEKNYDLKLPEIGKVEKVEEVKSVWNAADKRAFERTLAQVRALTPQSGVVDYILFMSIFNFYAMSKENNLVYARRLPHWSFFSSNKDPGKEALEFRNELKLQKAEMKYSLSA